MPSLQIPQVDRSHRARGQPELPGHLAHRRETALLLGLYEFLLRAVFSFVTRVHNSLNAVRSIDPNPEL
jgi:hypothetical protein